MSEQRSLVVRLGSLEAIETALARASQDIDRQVTALLARVNAEIVGWDPSTPSRAAEQDYQAEVRAGVERLTEALTAIRGALADVRQDAREAELRNAAILD